MIYMGGKSLFLLTSPFCVPPSNPESSGRDLQYYMSWSAWSQQGMVMTPYEFNEVRLVGFLMPFTSLCSFGPKVPYCASTLQRDKMPYTTSYYTTAPLGFRP